MDLAQDDQRHREMIEKTQPAVEIDSHVSRLDPLRFAAVRERTICDGKVGIEPRLEAEIADFLRHLKPSKAGLDAPTRVDCAVEYAKVGVTPAGRLQQVMGLGESDAVLNLLDGLVEAVRACKRHAQRVVSLHPRCRCLPGTLAVGGDLFLSRGFGERMFGPGNGAGVVAHPKCKPPDLLKKLGALDGTAILAQLLEARGEAALRALSIAGFPVQAPDLAIETSGTRAICSRFELPSDRLIVRESLGPQSSEREHICEPLAHRLHLDIAGLAAGEGEQRALVMADSIIVGVDPARPIAGSHKVAGTLELIRGMAPVMAQQFEISQSRRVRTDGTLERAARPLMQLTSAGKKKILVDDFVHERMCEPVSLALAALPEFLDHLGCNEVVEGSSGAPPVGRDVLEQCFVKRRPQHCGLLEQSPGVRR